MSEPDEFVIIPQGISREEIDQTKSLMKAQPMGLPRLSIYLAGNLAAAEFYHSLRDSWPEFDFCASWVEKFAIDQIEDSWQNASIGWPINIIEAGGADVLAVHSWNGAALRGALVEVGAALALHKTVLMVGENESLSTWRFHPSCYFVSDWEEARAWLRRFSAKRAKEEGTAG